MGSGSRTRYSRRGIRRTSAAVAVALTFAVSAVAEAATITVNVNTDANAADPANCELREAILAANADAAVDGCLAGAGPDVIDFNNTMTIAPTSELPSVTAPATLDAHDGPGCSGDRQVTLDGTATASAAGIELGQSSGQNSDGSTICGFRIGNFDDAGIRVGTDGNDVFSNRIGLFGLTAQPNGNGVVLESGATDNDVGLDAGEENVISGNSSIGVELDGADGNRIRGNALGTTPSGLAALPNGFAGINVGSAFGDGAANNVIGGSAAGQGNLISGNDDFGVFIDPSAHPGSSGNVVEGNKIGTDVTGTAAVPTARTVSASAESPQIT